MIHNDTFNLLITLQRLGIVDEDFIVNYAIDLILNPDYPVGILNMPDPDEDS